MISLVATHAEARRIRVQAPGARSSDFWRDIVEPHADRVRAIVRNARLAMKIADEALQTDAEWAVDQRMRYFEDAYGMLRHARALAPENADVLALLGRAADELGHTDQAIEALEACARVRGPDQTSPDVLGRLGAIQLRLGQRDAALRWLRRAQGPLRAETAEPLVHLANALAAGGEIAAAVDALTNALPAHAISYYSNEVTLVAFSLALLYDRDEQRGQAFEILDRMKASLQRSFGAQVQSALAPMRFAPAEDQHYYQALLYEALDQYVEARAAWALYAASGDAPWRARALDHIRAIDQALAARGRGAPRPAGPGRPGRAPASPSRRSP